MENENSLGRSAMSWFREPDAEPIPGYRLIEPLGSGGFGEVWKCEAPGGIYKAIKFVAGNLDDPEDDTRAEQEMKALQRIKSVRHPFVLQMDRIESVEGELVIVMELADRSLHDCLEEANTQGLPGIPRDLLLRYLHDAAEGLDYLISRYNLQHLDIKPRNLFVVADRVKVADFGLVKQLERSNSTGLGGGFSPFYSAPETFTNQVSPHSDQYSLAIVYQELLTGVRPFTGKNVRLLAMQHMNSPPNLDPLPENDREHVARALAKNPEERFRDCLTFIRTLAGLPVNEVSRWNMGVSLGDFQLPTERQLATPQADAPTPEPKGDQLEQTNFTPPEEITPVPTIQPVKRPPIAEFEDSQIGLIGLDEPPGELSVPESQVVQFGVDPEESEDSGMYKTRVFTESVAGVLRPSLMIGLGSFGRRALLELRCRLVDRVGELEQIPSFRFLYLDSDPEALPKAMNVSADVAMTEAEIVPMPLRPASGYRRRHLESLEEWLPPQKLYAIPRSLQPLDSRALGRLAFTDHHLRLAARFRREFQVATHAEAMSRSCTHSGLPLRSNNPQVFIFADACSGTAGGLMDLGVSLRRLLKEQRFPDADLIVYLFCGAPEDPATPASELANLHACVTELHHYAEPGVNFHARYGPDGEPIKADFPFRAVYLLPLAHRSPEALRDAVAVVSTAVGNELTTPLGGRLQSRRNQVSKPGSTPFRAIGSFSAWFPRGLLLREAARQMTRRLIEDWQANTIDRGNAPVQGLLDTILHEPQLIPSAVADQLKAMADAAEDSSPYEVVRALMNELEHESGAAALGDASAWSRQSLERVREVVGLRPALESDLQLHSCRISRFWMSAARQLADMWAERIFNDVLTLLDHPGSRLAFCETALRRIAESSSERTIELASKAQRTQLRTQKHRAEIEATLGSFPAPGVFRLFSSSPNRLTAQFLQRLGDFARHRLAEDKDQALILFYRHLAARLDERLGDLNFCRARLNHLWQAMAYRADSISSRGSAGSLWSMPIEADGTPQVSVVDPMREALRGANTLQVLLPKGEADLETAAMAFLTRLSLPHWERLEKVIQQLVLEPLGGLFTMCSKSRDLSLRLGGPLIDQTAEFLGELLPVADVAQVAFSSSVASGVELEQQLADFIDRARPLMETGGPSECIFLVPPGEAGERLGEQAKMVLPDVEILTFPNPSTDLVICRETGCLDAETLARFTQVARPAYEQMCAAPGTSPHSRFDVPEWIGIQ